MASPSLVFDFSIPKYLAAKGLGRWFPSLYDGPLSCLGLRAVPSADLPGADWVRVQVRYCGFCGSDLGALSFKSSPVLEPFNSFPCVLGHEVVGEVVEVGAGIKRVKVGDRVVVDPFLSCEARGLGDDPCPSCRAGRHCTCERAANAPDVQRRGMLLGFTAGLPGGFGPELVAHTRHVYRVPDAIEDDTVAALTEPLSIGLHAVLRRKPTRDERVLIVGGGMIAYSVLFGVRALGLANDVTLLTLLGYQRDLALDLGADHAVAVAAGDGHPDVLLAERCGATFVKPVIGPQVPIGGFDVVFDCVGSQRSVQDCLRWTRPGGSMLLLGNAGLLPKIDWTYIWSKEVRVIGSMGYGPEPGIDGAPHTFEATLDALAGPLGEQAGRLVTHTLPLSGYREAVRINVDRAGTRSVKTLLAPGS